MLAGDGLDISHRTTLIPRGNASKWNENQSSLPLLKYQALHTLARRNLIADILSLTSPQDEL